MKKCVEILNAETVIINNEKNNNKKRYIVNI
jgi:hypothetical protein